MAAAANQHFEWPHRPEGHQGKEAFVLANEADLLSLFDIDVVTQQAGVMVAEVVGLAEQFFPWNLRNRTGGPNLAVGMRIACAHHDAAVLENLYVLDLWHRSQFLELGGPGADHVFDVIGLHGGKSEVVAWGEADHPAEPGFAFGDDQPPAFKVETFVDPGRLERGEVIVENECAGVARVRDSADPGVSRTEVTGGVICRLALNRDLLEL